MSDHSSAAMGGDSAQITMIRLPDGKVIALVDWTDKPLFSTVDLLSDFEDQVIQVFNYVVSDLVSSSANITTRRTATDRDTNISSPGTFASTEEMLVYNIKVEPSYFNTNAETPGNANTLKPSTPGMPIIDASLLAYLHYRLQLQLEVTQKLYADASLGYFNQGFGVYAMGVTAPSDAAATPRSLGAQGFPSADAPRSFTIPVHIGGQENYRVNIINADGTNAVDQATVPFVNFAQESVPNRLVSLRIYLEGLYKRPVS